MKYMGSFGAVTTSLLVLVGILGYGCGPDTSESEPEETGGTSTGGTTTTGTGGTGAGGTTGTGGVTNGEGCPVFTDVPLITDFTEFAALSIWDSGQESFGVGEGVTGNTIHYNGPEDLTGTANLTAEITEDGALNIYGTIPATGYAGFGLVFGPTNCDASDMAGIQFNRTGTNGDAELQIQLRQLSTVPVEGDRGGCDGTWSEGCASNYFIVDDADVDTDPDYPLVQVPWASFTGGEPVAADSSQVEGLQFHFNCGEDADCVVDQVFDDISFY